MERKANGIGDRRWIVLGEDEIFCHARPRDAAPNCDGAANGEDTHTCDGVSGHSLAEDQHALIGPLRHGARS